MSDARSTGGVVKDERVPSTNDWIGLVRRQWPTITGCTLGVPILLVLMAVVVVPRDYEARATILVIPPEFSSSLRPAPVSVEGYQTLLESNAVVAETAAKLAAQGYLEEDDAESLRASLSSTVFTSSRGQPQVLSPLVELRARAPTAEVARLVAETWVETFFAASERMMAGQLDPVIDLVREQYRQKRGEVSALETERDSLAEDFLERIIAAENRWDERLADLQAEGEREIAEFNAETENLVAAYQSETRALLSSADGLSEGVSLAPSGTDDPLGATWRRLVSLRIQLAQTPQFISLARAITDEALWEARVSEAVGGEFPQGIVDQRLLSQELNPAYTALSLQLAEHEIALEAAEVGTDRRELVRKGAQRLEALQRERSAGLATMLAMRDAEARRLRSRNAVALRAETRDRRAALEALTSERNRALEALARDIQHGSDRLEQLAGPYEETALASHESANSGVALASPISASREQPPALLLTTLAALFLGAVLGLVAGVVVESR